ncbi:Nucleosome assembly protein (NAP) [Lasallia pustulata]|uniref:Nucleosome assembly protein (NAP) n=1 Tax=Lasallia pustulata TaxID=136370 RepID=A0A1W5DET9_9LECA|nr:Nucleosome assembly protein (NAP) [Lasallia pustulata]
MAASRAGNRATSPAVFELLVENEKDFADSEIVVLLHQVTLQAPIFDKRAIIIARIRSYWALVFEQAPPEIDHNISPSDSAILATLISLEVTRFEVASDTANGTTNNGDPRSLKFTFKFAANDYFKDKVLEKKFWYRRAENGWTGLVSEPVRIHWKKGKDLTNGLLDLAVDVWQRQLARAQTATAGAEQGPVQGYDELVKRVRYMNVASMSFFAWFGFRGRDVGAEESAEATRKEKERRKRVKEMEVVGGGSGEEIGAEGMVDEGSGEEGGAEGMMEEGSGEEDGGEGMMGERSSEEDGAEGMMEEGENRDAEGDELVEDSGESNSEGDSNEEVSGEGINPPAEMKQDEEDMSEGGIPLAEMEREIFPAGDDLAIALSEDLYPGATKYFFAAHERGSKSSYESSESTLELRDREEDSPQDPPHLDDEVLIGWVAEENERASENERPRKRKRI